MVVTYQHMKGEKGPAVYRIASGIITRTINSMPTQQVDEKSLLIIVLFESCPKRSYHIMPYKARIIKGAEMTAKLSVNILDKRFSKRPQKKSILFSLLRHQEEVFVALCMIVGLFERTYELK